MTDTPLLDYVPTKADENATHDIKARVYRNQTSKKEKEPMHIRAERYIRENPEIYAMFCRFAWQAINAGRTTLSAYMIAERIRWETEVVGNDKYKINNNYRPYLARKFMEDNPQHEGIFRTRETRHEKEKNNGDTTADARNDRAD